MKAQITIQTELKRRTDLIENPVFIQKAIEVVKMMGISSEEFNNNRMAILMLIANEFCAIENKQ
jgi:hypothetical protein